MKTIILRILVVAVVIGTVAFGLSFVVGGVTAAVGLGSTSVFPTWSGAVWTIGIAQTVWEVIHAGE